MSNTQNTNPNEYNGWTNRQTWNVNLWLSNDQGSYNYVNDLAQQCWQDNSNETDKTERLHLAACDLAELLESEHTENTPIEGGSVYSDLLRWALGTVEWYEIAKTWLEGMGNRLKIEEDAGIDDENESD